MLVRLPLRGEPIEARLNFYTDGGSLENYECVEIRPFTHLGETTQHGLFLIAFDDPNPNNPNVHYVDVHAYRDVDASDLGVSLANFLKQAQRIE